MYQGADAHTAHSPGWYRETPAEQAAREHADMTDVPPTRQAPGLPHLLDRLELAEEALRLALAELGPERTLKLAALSAPDEQEPA